MTTLALLLSSPPPTAPAAEPHAPLILGAALILVVTAMFMWRSVGPVLEILKAALYAVTSFFLIALVVVVLLIAALRT